MKSVDRAKQKNKKFYIKWVGIGLSVIIAAVAAMWFYINNWDVEKSMKSLAEAITTEESITEMPKEDAEKPTEKKPVEKPVEKSEDATIYSESELPKEPTIIKGVLLANKQHPLPATYAPGEIPEARAAFETMKAAAAKEGIHLNAFSTYRDFARQKQLYENYVAKDGQQAADRYSARPGYSEHQTGLTFDIGEAGKEQHWASSSFGDTEGGKWLAANSQEYGFILRYPKEKEKITGYMHESWHFRYVGKDIALEIYKKEITLEEYLGI